MSLWIYDISTSIVFLALNHNPPRQPQWLLRIIRLWYTRSLCNNIYNKKYCYDTMILWGYTLVVKQWLRYNGHWYFVSFNLTSEYNSWRWPQAFCKKFRYALQPLMYSYNPIQTKQNFCQPIQKLSILAKKTYPDFIIG